MPGSSSKQPAGMSQRPVSAGLGMGEPHRPQNADAPCGPAPRNRTTLRSPEIHRKIARSTVATVANAALIARRQAGHWQFAMPVGRPTNSNATAPHRQLPPVAPGVRAMRTGCRAARPSKPKEAGYSSNCGRSSTMSCQGAFEATKKCALGRAIGSSARFPKGNATGLPGTLVGTTDPHLGQKLRVPFGDERKRRANLSPRTNRKCSGAAPPNVAKAAPCAFRHIEQWH